MNRLHITIKFLENRRSVRLQNIANFIYFVLSLGGLDWVLENTFSRMYPAELKHTL